MTTYLQLLLKVGMTMLVVLTILHSPQRLTGVNHPDHTLPFIMSCPGYAHNIIDYKKT
jgi:hypothetical protein